MIVQSHCWAGPWTREWCCDLRASPEGRPDCWDATFTFSKCCTLHEAPRDTTFDHQGELVIASVHNGIKETSTCWGGGFTASLCCDLGVSPRGRVECWDGHFTFERCCINQDGLGDSMDVVMPAGPVSCWKDGFGPGCCDLRMSAVGRAECWSAELTYAKCCSVPTLRHGARSCERDFRMCQRCVSLLSVPQFERSHWETCKSFGGRPFARTAAKGRQAQAMCLPQGSIGSLCTPDALVELHLALQNQTYVPRFNIASCRPTVPSWTVVLLMILVFPFFCMVCSSLYFRLSGLSKSLAVGAVQGEPDHVISSNFVHRPYLHHNASVDFVRLLGVMSTVIMHMNVIRFHGLLDLGIHKCPKLQFLLRFTDAYTVAAVFPLTQPRTRRVGTSLDGLWRKLSRQLPIVLFPWYLLRTTFCTRAATCSSSSHFLEANEANDFSALMTQIFFSRGRYQHIHNFHLRTNLYSYLLVSALCILECHAGFSSFVLAWGVCLIMLLHGAVSETPHYLGLYTYRLPMALLVVLIGRTSKLNCRVFKIAWLRHILLGISLSLGWISCAGRFSESFRLRCLEVGWPFFVGGIPFHIALSWICLWQMVPKGATVFLHHFSELGLSIIMVHGPLIDAFSMCRRASSPMWLWIYAELEDFTIFDSEDYHARPHWAICLEYAALLCVILVTSQVAVWVIQRPWAKLLDCVPCVPRRILSTMYLVAFLVMSHSQNTLV